LSERVPTPEEFRKLLSKRRAGVLPHQQEYRNLRVANVALSDQVKKQEEEIARLSKRNKLQALSPVELRAKLDQLFEKYGVEPAEELIQLATMRDESGRLVLAVQDRIKIWSELLQYRMAKLKSMDVSGQVDLSLTIEVVKFGTGEVIEQKKLLEKK